MPRKRTASATKNARELPDLASDSALLESQRGLDALSDALASGRASLIAQAARLVAEHRLNALAHALRGAYRDLSGERAASLDPGASAKEAIVGALDAIEDTDADLFAHAALFIQVERSRGGSRDVAAPVRVRGALGLSRLGHADFIPILGACLGDPDPTVRLAAARAIAHREERTGAGLLLVRLGAGDDTLEVTTECLHGLLSLAPDLGTRHARRALASVIPAVREQTLQALGTSSADAAVDVLAGELATRALPADRRAVIEAIGLSLKPLARRLLLDLVSDDECSAGDADAALEALAIHRYDTRLVEELERRTAPEPERRRRFRELFLDGDSGGPRSRDPRARGW